MKNIFRTTSTVLLMMLIGYSCKQSGRIAVITPVKAKTDTINIPASLENVSFDYNKTLTDIRFVKLETTSKSIFGYPDRIFISDNRIIICDIYISKSVFLFDSSGKFIDKVGVGSDDHSGLKSIRDATFDYRHKVLSIFDDKDGKIATFDTQGKLIKKIAIKPFFVRFSYLKDSIYVLQTPIENRGVSGELNDFDLAFSDNDGAIKSASWSNEKDKKILPNYDYNTKIPSSGSGEFIYYSPKFSRTIYQVKNYPLSIHSRFYLNFLGKNDTSPSEFTTLADLNTMKDEKFYFDGSIISSGALHFIALMEKNIPTGVFYSSRTKKIYGGQPISRLGINEKAKMDYFSYPIASTATEFISILNPSEICEKEKIFRQQEKQYGIKPVSRDEKFDTLLRNLKKDDNQVLVFYKLKLS
ncbi:6-bladed beta-propeller [Pedobacter sp. 22226]|uniref:6-bladed beta-propeller n=1 Tax=Pedobacter sp. 22226 TaxID=3453894 RepID=UPI003F87C65A